MWDTILKKKTAVCPVPLISSPTSLSLSLSLSSRLRAHSVSSAAILWGFKLLVYTALATSVRGLKLLVYEALSY